MVNSSSTSCDQHIEEQCPGENLRPGVFCGDNSFCLVSGTDLLTFGSKTGQRYEIRRHSHNIVDVSSHNGMLVCLTDAPEIYLWGMDSSEWKLRRRVGIPDGYQIGWAYELDAELYVLVTSCEVDEAKSDYDSLLLKVALDGLTGKSIPNSDNSPPVSSLRVASTGKRPLSRRHMDIGRHFYVKCQGRRLIMGKFDDGDIDERKEDDERRLSDQFTLDPHFQVEDQCLVEFDSVKIAGKSLFCTLTVGRIYCWSDFKMSGLSASNSSHVTLTGHRVVAEFTDHGTMFVGTGNGLLLKYNISAASGAGRWHKLEQLSVECPIRSMMFSGDFALVVLIHSDNSVCIVRSSGLCLSGRAETIKKPIVNSVGVVHDPLIPRGIFTNSKIGCLQWIDPLRWKTTCESEEMCQKSYGACSTVDISEENVPPEDTFNRPDFLWRDVYSVCLSIPRIVTCEHRRNDLEKTYLKFWRRSSSDYGHLQMENCLVVPRRISFVRSTLDQFWDCSAVTVPMTNGQEFLIIFSNGEMEVHIQSENRGSLWCRDLKRHHQNWQQFAVKHCSSVTSTSRRFATVNSLVNNSHVSVWDLSTLSVVQMLDTLVSPEQVEWSTPPALIIACQFGIVSLDSDANTFIWAIQHPGMSISSNHLATYAYDDHSVYVINASNGTLVNGPLRFSKRQKKVIAVGDVGNVWFVGTTEWGSLSVLKPDLSQNKFAFCRYTAEDPKQKRTAFSNLMGGRTANGDGDQIDVGGRTNGPNHPLLLLDTPSIKQFVDGPAHSLPPITQLARQFVHACLAKKSAF